MVMPGDTITFKVKLLAPIAMDQGLRFAIREGGRTVGAGVVTKIDAGVGMWLLFIFLPVVGVFLVHKVNYTGGQITDLAARVPVSQPASSVVEPKDQQVATTVLSSSESVSSEQPRT
jgi:hypothetical protein